MCRAGDVVTSAAVQFTRKWILKLESAPPYRLSTPCLSWLGTQEDTPRHVVSCARKVEACGIDLPLS